MSLAAPEDAASVLEQFTHDVANTPAEITHLMEEIQAKDMQIAAFRDEINKRDMALQKWVRQNGGNVLNPKEEAFSKTINDCYDKCEILQAEKEGLATKALIVLDRQVRRLDINLRSLAAREEFPSNWDGPSLLSGSATGVSTPVAPVSAGPLQAMSGNIGTSGGAANIANAAQLRMAQSSQAARSGQQTPTSNAGRNQRESSTDASKRRRLNATLSIPAAGSNLRQSSLGPGTPKAGTPTGTSRAGSAQPQRAGAMLKKIVPPIKKIAPHQAAASSRNRKRPNKKGDRRRALARDRATPSTNASVSDSDGESTSPTPSSMPQQDGAADHGDEDEDDEQLYCFCQKVSFGNMVGCDNDNCEYQWFHWDCIGLKSEPTGEWLCPECRKLPRKDLVISRE
ncbi:chromatin modification-related protein YNG2-like [Teratosphaeria destructans]|uniref:Chromatin modification-related protein n=1 Tax=Teratosphaeria destructans TaxID=418781 RepID=A0A9W7W2N9_9PEZI|nr:chromatin modification-related protein YNG2-like [Teratosphaeria destructans]